MAARCAAGTILARPPTTAAQECRLWPPRIPLLAHRGPSCPDLSPPLELTPFVTRRSRSQPWWTLRRSGEGARDLRVQQAHLARDERCDRAREGDPPPHGLDRAARRSPAPRHRPVPGRIRVPGARPTGAGQGARAAGHPLRAQHASLRLPGDDPRRAPALHRLLRGRAQERRLPRVPADGRDQRPRLEHADGRPDRAPGGARDPGHLLRVRLLQHGARREPERARERGVRARGRVGDLALSPLRRRARPDGQGRAGHRPRGAHDDLRQHDQRPVQRLLGTVDQDGRPRRPHEGQPRERAAGSPTPS